MSRVLLTWELGGNYGHLGRLIPLAQRLIAFGHHVVIAVRDVDKAKKLFVGTGICCLQAPVHVKRNAVINSIASYSEILFYAGWENSFILSNQVTDWLGIYKKYSPDIVIHDFSPTAQLASRIAGIVSVVVGCGFDLPPTLDPLPAFPGFSWATLTRAQKSDQFVTAVANKCLQSFNGKPLEALKDIFDMRQSIMLTFAELDHYGERENIEYSGLIDAPLSNNKVNWIGEDDKRKIFAYLRPGMTSYDIFIDSLTAINADIICCIPGISIEAADKIRKRHFQIYSRPIDYINLLHTADLCLSYGALAITTLFLLGGVPQLLAPQNTQDQMNARNIENMGGGIVLRGPQTTSSVVSMMRRLLAKSSSYKIAVRLFSEKYKEFDPSLAADNVAKRIHALIR